MVLNLCTSIEMDIFLPAQDPGVKIGPACLNLYQIISEPVYEELISNTFDIHFYTKLV